MSDKAIVELYKSTGTGTGDGTEVRAVISGTGDGSLTPVPASEAEVVESRQVINKLLIALAFTVLTAIGQFLEVVAPTLAQLVFGWLPHVPFVSVPLISSIFLSVAAWMQKKAADKHKVAVVKALVTDPSEELKAAYEKQKKLGS